MKNYHRVSRKMKREIHLFNPIFLLHHLCCASRAIAELEQSYSRASPLQGFITKEVQSIINSECDTLKNPKNQAKIMGNASIVTPNTGEIPSTFE
jgi:hypothetical protein